MAAKKHPRDYPQMSFRISAADKTNLNGLTQEVLALTNQELSSEEKVMRKNDVLVDALYLGLLTLKKKGYRPLD